jgi:ubiquinone biosynthesis protein UbiJ
MTADEQARDELLRRLTDVLGEEAASRLMRSLPPDDWSSLARQEDLLALRQDVDGLRQDVDGLRQDVDGLRQDVDGLRQDVDGLRQDMERMETRLDHKIDVVRLELLAAFHQGIGEALVSNTRTSIFTMAGSLVGLAGLAMALARFT